MGGKGAKAAIVLSTAAALLQITAAAAIGAVRVLISWGSYSETAIGFRRPPRCCTSVLLLLPPVLLLLFLGLVSLINSFLVVWTASVVRLSEWMFLFILLPLLFESEP